jgi:hypothetical protein
MQKYLDAGRFYKSVGYTPHYGQQQFHAANARFKVLDTGRRWGKSTAGPHDKMPKLFLNKKEPVLGWVVAPTYDLGEKEFRVFWRVLIDQLKIPIDKSKTFYSVRTKDFRITTAWGASLEVRSAEHPDSLVGEGLDFVIMAEAAKLKLSHWEKYIRPTLSDKRGDAIFVSTPEGFNWFYDLYVRGQSEDSPAWWSIQSPTWDNSIVFPQGRNDSEIIDVEATLSPEVFDQEYGAKFTSFAGRIYSEFDEGYHIIPDYQFNPDWPNFLAFDWGFRNPFVCLNIQVDPSDNIYVWDEYYERNIITPEHGRRLKQLVQWRVDGGYYDPSGVDEVGSILQVFHDTREYNNPWLSGISMAPAPNEWKAGVERVKEWLKMEVDINTGSVLRRPKLFVSRECKNTIREFNTYRVKEQGEKAGENSDPKDEPRKKDDHAMDALRYFVAGHFGLGSHIGYAA